MDWDEFWRRRRRYWSFDDFLDDFERFFEDVFRDMWEMERRFLEDLREMMRRADREHMRIEGPYVYGFSITIGPDGRPEIREFGNVRRYRGRPRIIEEREPLIDVLESEDEITVVAEMPGVDKEKIDIKVSEDGRILTISASNEKRKYRKEIDLPAKVDPTSAKATYKNGVLEVKLKKKKEGDKGVRITVE